MSRGDTNDVLWMSRIEELLQTLEGCSDPVAESTTQDLVKVLLDVHKTALARILQAIAKIGVRDLVLANLLQDELVNSLLLVHNLHPDDLEMRVQNSVEQIRPFLEEHSGDVAVVGIADGVVRLRCQFANTNSTSLTRTLCRVLEETILANAPEIETVAIEERREAAEGGSHRIVPLPMVQET